MRKFGFRKSGKFVWNPKSGKILIVESGILGFGSRNLESHERFNSRIQVPLTVIQYLRNQRGLQGVESRIHDCKKNCLMSGLMLMMTTMIFCWFYFMKKGLKKKTFLLLLILMQIN